MKDDPEEVRTGWEDRCRHCEVESKMVDRNIGALLIMEEGKTKGMFTERDVMKTWVNPVDPNITPIKEVMTRDLIAAELDDDLDYAMSIMIQRGVRHLPVLDKGAIVSVLSMRDLVKVHVTNLKAEVHYLKDMISDIG